MYISDLIHDVGLNLMLIMVSLRQPPYPRPHTVGPKYFSSGKHEETK